jgi:hypothetical protein
MGTFSNNFSLILGISPAWKILSVGLLITLAAAWQSFQTREAIP